VDFFVRIVLLDIEVLPLNQVMEYPMSNDEQVALIQTLVDALSSSPDLFSCLTDIPREAGDAWIDQVDRSLESLIRPIESIWYPNASPQSYTTVMIRNIPRKCNQRMLMTDITAVGYGGKVDFLYVPTDISSAKNLGYAFINFMAPCFASEFRERFHKKHLTSLRGSRAGLSVTFAVIQGLEANIENVIKNASVHRIRNPEYLPLMLNKEHGRLVPCVMPHDIERRNSQSSQSSLGVQTSETNMFVSPMAVTRAMRAH